MKADYVVDTVIVNILMFQKKWSGKSYVQWSRWSHNQYYMHILTIGALYENLKPSPLDKCKAIHM